IAEPWRLELQADFLGRHAEIVVCGSDVWISGDASGNIDVFWADAEIKARFLAVSVNILNLTAMFRRDFVMKHGIRYRADLVIGTDLGFWIDCMRAGARFANIKQYLVHYRVHANSMSRRAKVLFAETRLRRGLVRDFFPALAGPQVEALTV